MVPSPLRKGSVATKNKNMIVTHKCADDPWPDCVVVGRAPDVPDCVERVRPEGRTSTHIDGVYLPMFASGTDTLILFPVAPGRWRADNSRLMATNPGIAFRSSPRMDARIPSAILTWGTEIVGVSDVHGWLRCSLTEPECLALYGTPAGNMSEARELQVSRHQMCQPVHEAPREQSMTSCPKQVQRI